MNELTQKIYLSNETESFKNHETKTDLNSTSQFPKNIIQEQIYESEIENTISSNVKFRSKSKTLNDL